MIFKVIGTNVETGQRFAATIKAPDAEAAQRAAARRGITVESVTAVAQAPTPAAPKARAAPGPMTAKPGLSGRPPQRVGTILQGMPEAAPSLEDMPGDEMDVAAPPYVRHSVKHVRARPQHDAHAAESAEPTEELAGAGYDEPAPAFVAAAPPRRRGAGKQSLFSSNMAKVIAVAAVLMLSLGGWRRGLSG